MQVEVMLYDFYRFSQAYLVNGKVEPLTDALQACVFVCASTSLYSFTHTPLVLCKQCVINHQKDRKVIRGSVERQPEFCRR